jgi:hypothetical protein
MTARLRRWLTLALAPIVATTATIAVAPIVPAHAEPGGGSSTADDGGDNPVLTDVLESTGRRYLIAKRAFDKSSKAQLKLAIDVRTAEGIRDELLPQAGKVAAQSYRTGSLSTVGFLLNSDSSRSFVDRAMSLNEMNILNDKKLRDLNAAVARVTAAKTSLDLEVRQQQQQLAIMNKQKEAAEKALLLVGGQSLTQGFVAATSRVAAPAPRNSSGDFSPESCNVNDPTTGGCITPRTYHMYKEVKKAGFKRFVGCHRNGGPFEHPKGRACDWSLQKSGFSVAHNADMRKYGNDLMAFLVRNADRLGILYVIWYKQIWFPATGWKAYHGPSAHTDHVHVSML